MLFRELLLNLFPKVKLSFNPISLFVNFISPRQYFTVILRKVIENYKFYLYDVNFDPFEIKIGFGGENSVKLFQLEQYFAYICGSELNGYRFYSPYNIGTAIAFVSMIKTNYIFKNYGWKYFLAFVTTVYYLIYVYLAQIKRIKSLTDEDFNIFIKFFKNFYYFICQQQDIKNLEILDEIFSKLLKEIDLFIFLFKVYNNFNKIFDYSYIGIGYKDFFDWLFFDEKEKYGNIINNFLIEYEKTSLNSDLTFNEKTIIELLSPADFQFRYIFSKDIFDVVDDVIYNFYDIDKVFKNDDLFEILNYLLDYTIYKENFLKNFKNYIFKRLNSKKLSNIELEDFLDGDEDIKELKKENSFIEKMFNFYVNFIGGFWIARGDSYYFRFFRKDLLKEINLKLQNDFGKDLLYYLGDLIYLYAKNVFYYQNAFYNVKLGKISFKMPYKGEVDLSFNFSAFLQIMNEGLISNLLEDFNQKDVKIYVDNKYIDIFKEYFSDQIKIALKNGPKDYLWFFNFDIEFNEKEIINFNYRLYTLDFWLFYELKNINIDLSKLTYLNILSILKQTMFGFIILYYYLNDEDLLNLYVKEIVYCGINGDYEVIKNFIKNIIKKYSNLLDYFINLEENITLFNMISDNWKKVKTYDIEDIIWFRGLLKNISFYNKRYFIPL